MIKSSLRATAITIAMIGMAALSPASAATDWSGWYAGLNVGGSEGTASWSDLVVPSEPGAGVAGKAFGGSGSGFTGGGQIGINFREDDWVYGVEFSMNGGGKTADDRACFGGFGDVKALCGERDSYRGDIAARLGWVIGTNLLYVKGGGSFLGEDVKAVNLDRFGTPEGSYMPTNGTSFGWLLGVGVEIPLCENVTGALEYDYSSYGSHKYTFTPEASADPGYALPFTAKIATSTSIVTLRVNYDFDL